MKACSDGEKDIDARSQVTIRRPCPVKTDTTEGQGVVFGKDTLCSQCSRYRYGEILRQFDELSPLSTRGDAISCEYGRFSRVL